MDPAALPGNTGASRITPFVINQKVVKPLYSLRECARDMNYIFKPKVPNCDACSFSSVGMAATAVCATQSLAEPEVEPFRTMSADSCGYVVG